MHPDGRSRRVTTINQHPFLNEPQHRHFAVFLAMLEDALGEVEHLSGLSPAPKEGILTINDADMAPGFAELAEPIFISIRREVAALARMLEIKPRRRSQARTIRALLTAELVRLDDSYARKLRGYGIVDLRANDAIDPSLDRIRSGLTTLLGFLGADEQPSAAHAKRPRE